MSTYDDYYIEILNTAIIYIYRYGNFAIYIVGTVGNLLSIFIFLKKSWKKNVCVFYFLIYLLLNSAYLNSVILGTAFIVGFNINIQDSSVMLCKLLYYTALLFSTLLPTVLILASIDRLLISSQNVDTRLYSSKRLAYFSISISTFFWIVFNIHFLIKVNIQQFDSSIFVCTYDQSKVYLEFISYSGTIINIVLCLVMIILCIFAFKNVRRIRSIPRQQRQQIRSMTKKDFQLLRCLYMHNIVYIILSTFISIVYVYGTIRNNYLRTSLEQAVSNFLEIFFNVIYDIIYCESFIIFIIVSKAFRHELKRSIYKIFSKNLMPLREEDNIELNVVSNNIVLIA